MCDLDIHMYYAWHNFDKYIKTLYITLFIIFV